MPLNARFSCGTFFSIKSSHADIWSWNIFSSSWIISFQFLHTKSTWDSPNLQAKCIKFWGKMILLSIRETNQLFKNKSVFHCLYHRLTFINRAKIVTKLQGIQYIRKKGKTSFFHREITLTKSHTCPARFVPLDFQVSFWIFNEWLHKLITEPTLEEKKNRK